MKASRDVLGEGLLSRAKVRGNQPERHQHSTVLCRASTAGLVVWLALLLFAALASVRPAWCEIVSVSSTGQPGDAPSENRAVSLDGRFVVFESLASNLVPGDTNRIPGNPWSGEDVFVRDRFNRTTERVSVSSEGAQANGWFSGYSISGDGRFVGFWSGADNLVPGDTNGVEDVFVRDRLNNGTTERVSLSSTGEQGDADSVGGDISADGKFVAFSSLATNLVSGDTNGIPGDRNSGWDVFVRDRLNGTTERVSLSSAGDEGNASSSGGTLSANGRFVVFSSYADNLVSGDTNGVEDVFVHDRETGETTRVSIASDGSQMNYDSLGCAISGDGRYVSFLAPHVFLRDRLAAKTIHVAEQTESWFYTITFPALSADGTTLAYNYVFPCGTPAIQQCPTIALYDVQRQGLLGNIGGEKDQAVSGDGRFVAYTSGDQVYIFERPRDGTPPDTVITQCPACYPGVIAWRSNGVYVGYPAVSSWRLDAGEWQAPTIWDFFYLPATLPEGKHVFEVKAIDLAGNEDPTPARCGFFVDSTLPTVSISSPSPDANVRGTVTITADASDPSGIFGIEFRVRGQSVWVDKYPPYSYEWDTSNAPQGPAQVCARAYDTCGHYTDACITVNVRKQTFEDVPVDNPAWLAIEAIAARGITNGCSMTPPLFCPYATVTKAQVAVFICRAAGKTWLDRPSPTFTDVPKDNPYYGWIERFCDPASWGGTAPGTPCAIFGGKKFCPTASVSRQEIAWILCRATGKAALDRPAATFADVPTTNPYRGWIERLADTASWPGGIAVTNGCACPSIYPQAARCYCPKSPLTRAQLAVFLVRAFGIPL
jgi:hypothetical protein